MLSRNLNSTSAQTRYFPQLYCVGNYIATSFETNNIAPIYLSRLLNSVCFDGLISKFEKLFLVLYYLLLKSYFKFKTLYSNLNGHFPNFSTPIIFLLAFLKEAQGLLPIPWTFLNKQYLT